MRSAAEWAAWLLWLALPAAVAHDPVPVERLQGLADARHVEFHSSVLERPLQVFVRVPPDARKDALPAVYLLDGGITFPLLAAYQRYLELAEELPPVIVVGIGYGTDRFEDGNLRGTDYTAPSDERDHWGGAPRFQRMLREELLPYIERDFGADPGRRVIFGQSLGGQFVLFTASVTPGLFQGHIASNPALHRNLDWFLAHPDPESVHTPVAALFVSSATGDDPQFRGPAMRWIEHWDGAKSLPWLLETRDLRGHGHFSAAPVAYRDGLRWIMDTWENHAGPWQTGPR
ncbi:MAG: alpha/beta hydrolase-fold protein [Xanthomonadales bacterium]|nr:alpha/beta hydrolase-fold protein [Xanthomonadales bacterium]